MFLRVGICAAVLLCSVNALAQENSPQVDPAVSPAETKPPAPAIESAESKPQRLVAVKTEKEVLVEQRDSETAPWRHICAASSKSGPCSFAPGGGQYRVIGVDVSPSAPFVLTGPGALQVDIGHAPLSRRGVWITGAAAAAVTLGLVLLFSSSALADLNNGSGPNGVLRDEKIGVLAAGSIFAIGGLTAGLYGGALYYDNSRSRVSGPIGDARPRTTGFWQRSFKFPLAFTF